jgi:hypothetical protein
MVYNAVVLQAKKDYKVQKRNQIYYVTHILRVRPSKGKEGFTLGEGWSGRKRMGLMKLQQL